MKKACEMCGKPIDVKDNRRKYCDECRKVRKHFFDVNSVHKAREKARERRRYEREHFFEMSLEIESLRSEVIRLRSENRRLRGERQ